MPPKPKYGREEIAGVALQMIKEEGMAALTARDLGKRLGTSASPIFTMFKNMDDVKLAARELALEEFQEYIGDYKEYTPAFKRIGMMMVSYAIHQPNVFKLLFMQEHEEEYDFSNTIKDLGESADVCKELIMHDYDMTQEQAELMFEQMWVYTYGLGVLCATRVCHFSEEEIGKRLGVMFASLAMFIKTGNPGMIYGMPEKRTDGIYQGKGVGDIPYIMEEQTIL